MSKRKRTRFVGAYPEPPAPSIDLPLTLANFRILLAEGARSDARYTHQQIKAWAERFWRRYTVWLADPDASATSEMEAAANLAQEIEMQWGMYLANTHTLLELQRLDFAQVRLPTEWFVDWLARLNQLAPPTVSE